MNVVSCWGVYRVPLVWEISSAAECAVGCDVDLVAPEGFEWPVIPFFLWVQSDSLW